MIFETHCNNIYQSVESYWSPASSRNPQTRTANYYLKILEKHRLTESIFNYLLFLQAPETNEVLVNIYIFPIQTYCFRNATEIGWEAMADLFRVCKYFWGDAYWCIVPYNGEMMPILFALYEITNHFFTRTVFGKMLLVSTWILDQSNHTNWIIFYRRETFLFVAFRQQ